MPSSPSSSSLSKHIHRILVFLCRIGVGAVFIVSGWAKAVDPYGFIYKVTEYLSAWDFLTLWGMEIPREVILAGCVGLSTFEFVTGACVITGTLRRFAVWCAALLMAFMLPLTLYIALYNPVSDCGCFGDFLVLSNWNTFYKNVIISAAVIYLLIKNKVLPSAFPPALQWIAIAVFTAYLLILSFLGYHVQPLVDFRPYPVESHIFDNGDEQGSVRYIYSRNGQTRSFGLDELPDSSWTYIGDETQSLSAEAAPVIAVLDDEGEEVTDMIVEPDMDQLWLIVAEPRVQFLSGSHFVRQIYDYCLSNNIEMNAVVAGQEGARIWRQMIHPDFPVYSAEDTALKALVRGSAAVVFTSGGTVKWKRTLNSMDSDMLSEAGGLRDIQPVEDGRILGTITFLALGVLVVLAFFGVIPVIVRRIISLFHKKNVS